MRRFFRGILHLIAMVCVLVGLALAVATVVTWNSLITTEFSAAQNNAKGDLAIYLGEGRLLLNASYDRGIWAGWPMEWRAVAEWIDAPTSGPAWIEPWWSLDLHLPEANFHFPKKSLSPSSSFEVVLPAISVGGALMLVGLLWLAPAVKRWLTRRVKSGVCLHCGYNLTGVAGDTCPECGAERALVTVTAGREA